MRFKIKYHLSIFETYRKEHIQMHRRQTGKYFLRFRTDLEPAPKKRGYVTPETK